MKIFALITCIPGESEPCWPRLFSTREAAESALKEAVREEWEYVGCEDDEGNRLPMPEDPYEAHELIGEAHGIEWGLWRVVELDTE